MGSVEFWRIGLPRSFAAFIRDNCKEISVVTNVVAIIVGIFLYKYWLKRKLQRDPSVFRGAIENADEKLVSLSFKTSLLSVVVSASMFGIYYSFMICPANDVVFRLGLVY